VLAAAFWAATVAVDRAIPLLSIPIALVIVGFYGTQWLFYFRMLTDRELHVLELPGVTLRFVGRFVRLGIIVVGPLILFGIVIALAESHGATSAGHSHHLTLSTPVRATLVLYELIIDMLLTFVSPSLVYATTSAREALRLGLGRLRTTWPSSAWYMLTPGLTLSLVAFVLPQSAIGTGGALGIAVGGGLLGLAFKGAIASFYLRSLSRTERRAGGADP
jgi:hypothetical protein